MGTDMLKMVRPQIIHSREISSCRRADSLTFSTIVARCPRQSTLAMSIMASTAPWDMTEHVPDPEVGAHVHAKQIESAATDGPRSAPVGLCIEKRSIGQLELTHTCIHIPIS